MIRVIIKKSDVYDDGTVRMSSSYVIKFVFEKSRDAVLFKKAVLKELGTISVEIERIE